MSAGLRVEVVRKYRRRSLVEVTVDSGTLIRRKLTLDQHFGKATVRLLVDNDALLNTVLDWKWGLR